MREDKNPSMVARLTYYMVLGYASFCRLLPPKGLVVLGAFLGTIAYFVDTRHRRNIRRNLAFAYDKNRGDKWVRRLALKNFQQFAIIAHEWMCLKNPNFEKLDNLISVRGIENLQAAKKKSPSVILIGAHFGNWEYGHLYYARNINKLNFIVRAIDNPFLELERLKYNAQGGVNILYKDSGLRAAVKGLRRGEDLVIFVDRNTNLKEGLPCLFFEKRASALTIAVQLSQRMGLPLVPMFTIRNTSGKGHQLVFLPEVSVDAKGNQGLKEGVQKLCDTVEAVIRRHPDHWIWFHKRWKHFYPELYPEDMAKRERRRAKRQKANSFKKRQN